jgi:D-glycero-D-manno-heptose 1,7-bisphosphate phosphatase
LTKAVFLDRDGVINRKASDGEYVTRWEDFHILPGVAEGVALLNRASFSVLVVTNQRCIAKGLLTTDELEEMHKRMTASLARAGAHIDAIYYCPHELEPACDCRKPAPGMLLNAARAHGIELPSSWMIGDSDIDVEAGRNAGCKTVRLLAEAESLDEAVRGIATQKAADIVASSFLDAVRKILQREGATAGYACRGACDHLDPLHE